MLNVEWRTNNIVMIPSINYDLFTQLNTPVTPLWSCEPSKRDTLLLVFLVFSLKMDRRSKLPSWIRNTLYPNNLYHSMNPVLMISFIYGLTIHSVSSGYMNRQFHHHLMLSYVFRVAWMLFYCSCFAYTSSHRVTFTGFFFKTEISVIGDIIQSVFCVASMCIIYGLVTVKRNTFVNVVHDIVIIDDKLKGVGLEVNYRRAVRYIFCVYMVKYMIYIIYMIGCFILFKSSNMSPGFTAWVAFFFPHALMASVVVIFVNMTMILRARFEMLNKVNELQ